MNKFEWQTDEDDSAVPVFAIGRQRIKRTRYLFLFVVLLFAGTSILIFWQLQERAVVNTNAVEQDVLVTFYLWRQAVERSDADMLDTLLADGDPEWTNTQRQLIKSGLYLERSSFGLSLQKSEHIFSTDGVEIELSPNWRSAQLTFNQSYVEDTRDIVSSSIKLKQTVFFERLGSRWVLSKPGKDFWGDWLTWRGSIVSVKFQQRDERIAKRLGQDLDLELKSRCVDLLQLETCPADAHLDLRLESDPDILFNLVDQITPVFRGRSFVLPTPTLVGLPVDDKGYQVLFAGYVHRLSNAFIANLESPTLIPNQDLFVTCYIPQGRYPRIFRHDLQENTWTMINDDRSFRYLTSSPSDDALVLWERMPGGANALNPLLFRGNDEYLLINRPLGQGAWYRIIWTGLATEPQLLLQSYGSTPEDANYTIIDTSDCSGDGCELIESDGLPIWSPDGQHTLIQRAGEINLGDRQAKTLLYVSEGFSPFWLDDQHFGFARFINRENMLQVDLLISSTDHSEHVSVSGLQQLAELHNDPKGKPIFIEFITNSQFETNRLLIYGRQYAGEDSRYFVFSALLDGYSDNESMGPYIDNVRLIVSLDSPPAGFPSALVPSGFAPFSLSPDERWLTVSILEERQEDLWSILVFELERGIAKAYSTRYPSYSFRRPYYDWSADSQWLVITDDGFLRLVSPELDIERFIPHGLLSCSNPIWIDNDVEFPF